jgi:large subunit ribosomal protein L28
MLSRCQLLAGRLAPPQTLRRVSQAPRQTPAPRTYATFDSTPIPQNVPNPLKRRKDGDLGAHLPKHVIPADTYMPPYPYGDHALYKQANRGLYGDQMIQFGNNVSVKTETKTRRDWKPNVLNKALYSVALKKKVKLRVTARVLKTMDREGGLDEYLLKDDEHRVKEMGPLGWALRWTLMQKPAVVERMRAQAVALSIDQAAIDAQWPTPEMQAAQRQAQSTYVKAADVVGDVYEETEEDGYADEETQPLPAAPRHMGSKSTTQKEAQVEFEKAIKAARRYVERENVDSEETGIRLAFLRSKEREEAARRNEEKFKQRLREQFSDKDVEETRAKFGLPKILDNLDVRKIAYNQWRRQQIEELGGSWEAWHAKKSAERIALSKERHGQDYHIPHDRSYKNADLLAEAESAARNEDMNAERRAKLQRCLNKADIMIQALRRDREGAKNAYATAMVRGYAEQ